MDVTRWRAGAARVTITPPVGMPLLGFAGRAPSDGVHDDLKATALVLEGPGPGDPAEVLRLAIIACDLLWLEEHLVSSVRQAVSRLANVPPEHVVVVCSHTHYGPLSDPREKPEDPRTAAYAANLVHLLAGAVAMAEARLTPCRLGFGQGHARIGINRRQRMPDGRIILGQNPDGPCDTRAAMLRLDTTDGRPLALLLNHACHPVSLGGTCTQITADFPGVARDLVEGETGATVLFVQGACGDVNPLLMGWDWDHPRRLGTTLGHEAVRVYETIGVDTGSGRLGIARSRMLLPPLLPESVDDGEALVADLEAQLSRPREAAGAGARWWAKRRLAKARAGLDALKGGTPLEPVPAWLAAVGMGETALVTVSGEVFTELGRSIVARSPFAHTLVGGYSDGSSGYLPTREAYAEGGYEVTHACRVAPEAGDLLVEEALHLLDHARNG